MAVAWNISRCDDFIVGPNSAGPFEGEDYVIFRVHWEVTDEQTEGEQTYYARENGSTDLRPVTGGAFTAWGEVTEAQALGWLHDRMGEGEVERLEENVAIQLSQQVQPTTESGIPWEEIEEE